MTGTTAETAALPSAQAARRRREEPERDPPRGGAARDRRGARRHLDRAARHRGRDEQERALCPLRLEAGASARDDRGRKRRLQRARRGTRRLRSRQGLRGSERSSSTSSSTSRATSIPAAASSPRSPPRWTLTRARFVTWRSASPANGSPSSFARRATGRPRARSIPSEDPEQLAFEIDSYLLLANAQYVVLHDPAPLDRARRAVERRLAAAARATGLERRSSRCGCRRRAGARCSPGRATCPTTRRRTATPRPRTHRP